MQFNSSKQNKKAYSTEVKAVYQAVSFCQRLEFDWTRLGFFYQSMIFPTRLSWNPQPSWTLQNCPGPTQAILCPFRVSLGPDDPLQIVMVSKVSDSTKNVKYLSFSAISLCTYCVWVKISPAYIVVIVYH